jgi:pimeloyl-ACP methyl ester carboxylesterase
MTAQIQRSSRVVFVPGAAGAATFWRPIIERLPAHLEPQAFDLPGLGAVPPHVGIHGYDGLVEYVRAGIDAPAIVVAQSMGAYIALTLALRHPHLVTRLVLVAATGGVDVDAHGAIDWRADYAAAYPHAQPWAVSPVADVTNRLHEIGVPMLLIWPSRDLLSPITIAHALAARARAATIMTFDSSDHWVAHQFPSEIAAAIASFAGLEP